MLDATVTLFAILGVVGACTAGVLALPWSDAEVRESVGAWSTLGRELARLAGSLGHRSSPVLPAPLPAPAR